jgi:hypothetical protein
MRFDNLNALGNRINVRIPPDETGFTGRECPAPECKGYFKIEFGSGLKGENLPCHCPYCGHIAGQDKFYTKAQIEYAKSVVLNRLTGALLKDLKSLEFEHRPYGAFGIGISMKVHGQPHPVRYYRENKLETEVVCSNCTLRYAIYGVFAFCPDCGIHNSLQILDKNFELCLKEVELACQSDDTLKESLIGDALENAVSAFDGFAREASRIAAIAVGAPPKSEKLSFQNLPSARERIRANFGFDFVQSLTEHDWTFASKSFHKRHLLAHKMGIVDEAYLNATKDSEAYAGRKVSVRPEEVTLLTEILRKLASTLFEKLPSLSRTSER